MNPIQTAFGTLFGNLKDSEQLGSLSEILELPVADILRLPSDPRVTYRPFTIKKRRGGERSISAPSGYLKKLQRSLLHNYLHSLPIHPLAYAYRRGNSIASHAKQHLNQQIVLSVDLADFFLNTTTRRVRHFYAAHGWQDETLRVLVRLSTFRGGLPQGAPTSPVLSNLVNFDMDTAMHELAMINGAQYSRYADDLAFSWASRHSEPKSFRSSVENIFERYGYQVQAEKGWKQQRASETPELTGIAIDANRLLPRKEVRRERRRLRWKLFKSRADLARLAGLDGFVNQLRRR